MNDTTLPISFKFGLDDIGLIDTRPSYYRSPVQINIGSVDFEIEIVSTHDTSRIDEIKIHIIDTGDVIVLRPNETDQINSVVINGRESKALFSTYRLSVTPGSLLPEIIIIQNPNNDRVNRQYLVNPGNILEEEFSAIVNLIVPKKIARSNVKSLAHSLAEQWPITRESIADCIRNLELSSLDRLADSFEEGGRTDIFERLHTASIANIIPRLMTALSRSTTTIISDTMYIGPARARSERYYRYQDLSVSEIDADGKNFPMFLHSLNKNQLEGLSQWIEALFGYGLSVNRSQTGHISIELKSEESTTNIVDTGYGISQILPVLGQIWWASNRPIRGTNAIQRRPLQLLAIEQPELHIHPAHQAILADALVGGLRKNQHSNLQRNTTPVHYVIETHSETLVNRLGELIGSGQIPSDDVQILIFDVDEKQPRTTSISIATFDESGILLNWPYGFFQVDR